MQIKEFIDSEGSFGLRATKDGVCYDAILDSLGWHFYSSSDYQTWQLVAYNVIPMELRLACIKHQTKLKNPNV